MQELEHWKNKFDVAGSATEGYFSRRWISKKLFGMSDEEFLRNQRELFYDREFDAQLELAGDQAAEGGGDLGDVGDTFEDEPGEGGSPEDLDTGIEDLAGGEGDEGGDEAEDVLPIQPPGSRITEKEKENRNSKTTFKDGTTTTTKSKGKRYTPVKSSSNKFGAQQRSTKGSWNNEITKSTVRNTFKGASDLERLAKGSLTEKSKTNYSEQEKKILETNKEVSVLIEALNLRSTKDETKAQ
tara:strand:- start:811 stop:1533 length:723 start_codon:yes stop_codon:yes gene_type:complete